MSSCAIHLDNFQGEYHPGANVRGRVICSLRDSENIREIRVKLKGAEHTSWTGTESYYDSRTKKTKTRTVQYTGNNTFLHLATSLAGSGEFGPGRLEYPFSFILPQELPGTYHGKYGWIKYTLKATVDRPFAFDYEDEASLKVVALIDFNTMIDSLDLEPVSYSDDKMICCCCCASGPITMNVHYEKEAYVPGETVQVKVEITNLSNESITSLDVKLDMTVESKTTSPKTDRKYDRELLAAHNDTGVGAHGERTYEFGLVIPQSTPVPNFDLCTLFKQWTNMTVTAVLPGCHHNLEITSTVVMGNIPVRERGQVQNTGVPYSEPVPPYIASTDYPPAFPTLPAPATCGPKDSSGPSAPPPEDVASAPPKAELAAAEDFSLEDVPDSNTGGDANELFPPPSYNEAITLPPYQPK